MLQWMGGSRRKVNDSRRSKQKRQKQYFEQRKRQQHEHIISSADNFVDGYNTCNQNQKQKRSLDVLSLHSLSQVAEGCSSACDGIPKVDCLPDKCPKARNLPNLINRGVVTPASNVETLQRSNISNNPEQRMPEEELRIKTSKLCNSASKEKNPEGEELKHAFGHKCEDLSVFELIDEEGRSSNNSEEKNEHEAHVAFSMQGLGKVGTETPVKSPQPSRRILSDGESGFSNASTHQYSCRNFDNLLQDHEMDMEPMVGHGDMFSSEKCISSDYGQSWRFCSSDHPKLDFFKDNSIELHNKKPHVKSFDDDKEAIGDLQEIRANFLEVRSGLPVGSSFNEEFDMPEENGCFTGVFNISRTHEADFTENFSFPKSDQYGRADGSCNLDFSGRYPKQQLTEDYDFLRSGDSNYFTTSNFTNARAKPSHFSYLKTDNPMDNFSSLSGESCSSSAVNGDGIFGVPTRRKSRKRSCEFAGVPSERQSITEDFYEQLAMSTKCIRGQQGECERPRAYSRSCDLYPSRPVHAEFLDFTFGESFAFGQVDDCTQKDGFHSMSIHHLAQHTDFGSLHHSSSKNHHQNWKPVGEDIFGLLSASNIHFDSHLSFDGCKDDSSVESASPMDLPSKKSAFAQDFTSFSGNRCGKSKKGSHQGIGTFVQSSESTGVSGKRENIDLLTEHCSTDGFSHDISINNKASHEEEIYCVGPEGRVSVTPELLQGTPDKLYKKNGNGILGRIIQENDNDRSSFVGLSDNSSSRATEKECRNNNLDLQPQQLDPGTSESEQKSLTSDGEDPSIEPSYQLMMLESHMLRLLCIKKKRKSAQREEILKRV